MNFWSRMTIAARAFKEAYVTANAPYLEDFDAYEGRQVRYDLLFAMYENTVYRNIHTWAHAHKTVYGLYKAIRNIYNPTFRLVEFWKMMIFGGLLDDEAGEAGAIPILTEQDGLRDAIAALWKASNWKLNKDLVPLYGVSMGDVGIKPVDDPSHQEVYLEVIHPSCIASVDMDTRGNIKGYRLEDVRVDEKNRKVKFAEVVTRGEGDAVIYRTYKDGKLFPWNGITAQWEVPYGFVPFVLIKHSDIGRTFGWAEVHPGRSKVMELDDMASKLHDYIRKAVDPIWLFNFKNTTKALKVKEASSEATEERPEPIREKTDAIYVADSNAKAQPLVTDLVDIEKTANEVQNGIAELERDFPELQMDIWTVGGYTTGKALRTARQRVERKVIQRRTAYDLGLVAAQGMSVAIGGWRGYEGYAGFNLESYKVGKLKHSIPATRPIFQTDVLEGVEIKQIFWNIIALAKKQGLPVSSVLADLGWSPTRIAKFEEELAKVEPPEPPDNTDNTDNTDNIETTATDVAASGAAQAATSK